MCSSDLQNTSMSRANMDKNPDEVAAMFDGVAKRYDLVNDLLSLGQTKSWRRKTTAIIAEVVGEFPKHPNLNILGVGQTRTTGLRRGVVADIDETTRSITKALQEAEQMAGAQVQTLYAGIAGEHVQAMTSKGIASVTGSEISKADIERANAVARRSIGPLGRSRSGPDRSRRIPRRSPSCRPTSSPRSSRNESSRQ